MPRARPELTAEIELKILAALRAGGFPHVAAEIAGVARETFDEWLTRGTGKRPPVKYRRFANEVRTAIAQARLKAEMQVLAKDPRFWLKYGPGKETADRPGWSNAVKPLPAEKDAIAQILASPEWIRIYTFLLRFLEPFPEARAAVAHEFDRLMDERGSDAPRNESRARGKRRS
jgi:hypothetical protein